jgi:hypothetical protein
VEEVERAVGNGIHESLTPLATPITDLRELEGNPRRGDVQAVARSLQAFGQRKPVVAHAETGEIIAGNHTWKAAKKLGWDAIAVLFVTDDDATAKAYALADNRTADLGDYDNEALAEMIEAVLDADEELLHAASFTEDDLNALLAESVADTGQDAEEDVEAPGQRSNLNLFDRFMVPPFSVLDARGGWWQDRKRAWIDFGIEGELGREDKPRTWYIGEPGTDTGDAIVDEKTVEERRSG